MAEIRNPKKYYYAMRSKYQRMTKQIGHKLSLAMSDEEDALLWSKYKKTMDQWRALENPREGRSREESERNTRKYWKPVFNETYVEMTQMLVELYEKRSGMDPCEERDLIDAKIERIKEKRKTVTTYIDRETGEEMCWR